MVFSSRTVDWRRGASPLAGYYSMSDLPKDLRGKVKLDPSTDTAVLYSSKTTIWPRNKELDLGRSGFRKEYDWVLFYRNSVIKISVPFKHRPSSSSPVLEGALDVELSIDGDLGASKLVERVFNNSPELNELDDDTLRSLVREMSRGKWKSMLEGLDEGNLRDPEARQKANEQTKTHLGSMVGNLGLRLGDLNIRWKKTETERIDQFKGSLERKKGTLDAKIEQDALNRLSESKNRSKLEAHRAETMATEFLEEDRTRQETAVLRRKADIESAEQARDLQRRRYEGESKIVDAEFDEGVTDLQHGGEMKRKRAELELTQDRIETDLIRKQTEAEIDRGSKDQDVDRIVKAALALQGKVSEETIVDLLKPEGEGGKSYEFADVINPDLEEALEQGMYTASEIEGFITELARKTKDPGNSRERLSDIWAGLALFHRHRGNKGGSMDEAISKSLQFNGSNPMAMKCRMDYLWNRHPQQFFPGKLERFKDQLIEIESLLAALVEHADLGEDARSAMAEKHKRCLKALSADGEAGGKWKDKLEAKYEMAI
ncbi:MAG: hypothetical protein QGH57_00710 [Candidatus Thalassarchaeaceae archaeon]|jgi:hypothetical protein|nr:hypothetical protein [Candidatus Thalassarchaeaceae archaeon]